MASGSGQRASRQSIAEGARLPILILLFALILRLVNLAYRFHLQGDETAYDLVARNILSGVGFAEHDWYAFRYPGYCYFIAFTYLFGGVKATIVVQILIGVGTCLLAFLIARRWFGATAGIVALIASAVYVPFIRLPGRLFTENLSLPLIMAFWLAYDSARSERKASKAFGAGVILGVGLLCRESALAFVVPVFLFDLVKNRRIAVIAMIGCALAVAPWTARNYLVFHRFVFVTTNGPCNIYYGAQANATGLAPVEDGDPVLARVQFFPHDHHTYRHDPANGVFQELEIADDQMRAAKAFIIHHPSQWLGLALKKFYYFWALPSVTYFNVHNRLEQALEWIWNLMYVALVIFGLAGAWRQRDRLSEMLIPYGLLVMPMLISMLSVVVSRYRFPTDIALMFFASSLWAAKKP